MTSFARRALLAIAIVTTIGCDRVTKHLAITTLAGTLGRTFAGDMIRFEYVENTGGFLSLGASLPLGLRTSLFTFGTGVLLLAVVGVAVRYRWSGWSLLGLALFVAGGASNWIDRLSRGKVVDFVSVGVGPLRTGIFNVADVAILAGAIVVVVSELWPEQETASGEP
jgi:signal peptidase II